MNKKDYIVLGFVGLLSAVLVVLNCLNLSKLEQFEPENLGIGIYYPAQGGTGTSTPPSYGQMLVGNSGGTYTLTATSSLGITGSAAAEVYTGTVATSAAPTIGNLAYWTSSGSWPETLGTVATTSLTATSPLVLSQPISVIGGSASALTCNSASASQAGCLSAANWAAFNNKWDLASTTIPDGYFAKTGDWTGTFDGFNGPAIAMGTTSVASLTALPGLLNIGTTTGLVYLTSGNIAATTSLGSDIVNYTGNWTGLFDGQEGSYYLNASNLNNFGIPFYTYFSATTTSALTEGTNFYWTDGRFDARLAASTTIPTIITLANLSILYPQISNFRAGWDSIWNASTTIPSIATLANLSITAAQVSDFNASVNSYIHASSTIPKLYTNNTFTGGNTFQKATTTVLTVSGLANCDTIDTDANGFMSCGTDGGGGTTWGKTWELLTVSSLTPTTTPMGIVVTASSTIPELHMTYATSGLMTILNQFYDKNNDAGSLGNLLSSTGSQIDWIATSSLGLPTFAGSETLSNKILSNTTFSGTLDLTDAVTTIHTYASFVYATTTAWTGTTTIPLGPAYTAETWYGVKCFTDTGTVNISFYDGTNRMDMLNASTTVGSFAFSANNTFTANEKRYADIGTPASSPTKISCTVDKLVND